MIHIAHLFTGIFIVLGGAWLLTVIERRMIIKEAEKEFKEDI